MLRKSGFPYKKQTKKNDYNYFILVFVYLNLVKLLMLDRRNLLTFGYSLNLKHQGFSSSVNILLTMGAFQPFTLLFPV